VSGVAEFSFASNIVGVTLVAASVSGASSMVDTHFVADASSAALTSGSLTVTSNNAVADGKATNEVTATVTDANGNLVSGAVVTFATTNGVKVDAELVTTVAGVAKTTLKNTVAGITTVNATVNSKTVSVDTTFTSAVIKAVLDNASPVLANGLAVHKVNVSVLDATGKPFNGVAVTVAATGATPTAQTYKTGADGKVTISLTSVKAGSASVTVSYGNLAATPVAMLFKTNWVGTISSDSLFHIAQKYCGNLGGRLPTSQEMKELFDLGGLGRRVFWTLNGSEVGAFSAVIGGQALSGLTSSTQNLNFIQASAACVGRAP
jgi:adhesin/invasin